MMLDAAFTAAPAMPDMTKAATTAPSSFALPAQAPMMKTPRVDQALVMSQSVKPEQPNAHTLSTIHLTKFCMMRVQVVGGWKVFSTSSGKRSQDVLKMCCEGTQNQKMSTKYSCLFNHFINCTAHKQHLFLDMLSAAHAQQLQLAKS